MWQNACDRIENPHLISACGVVNEGEDGIVNTVKMLSILPPRGPRVRVYGSLLVLFLSLTSLLLFFHDSLPMVKDFTILDNVHGGFTPNHKSTLQEDPPPQGPPYGDLVIAAQNTTDLTWTSFTKPKYLARIKDSGLDC